MSAGMFYVCDACGHIEISDAIPEDGEWSCMVCGSHRAWEFPPERRNEAETHAAHAAHIARGIGKGSIFRHARAV